MARVTSKLLGDVKKKDVIAKIPFELVIEVFKYLPPSAPLILQRVSKTWQTRLITCEVLDVNARSWFNDDEKLICQSTPDIDQLTIAKKKAETMLRFINGKPATMFQVKIDMSKRWLPYITPSMSLFAEDGWIKKRDLRAGGTIKDLFECNDLLRGIHLTDSVLLWSADANHLNVCDLTSGQLTAIECDLAIHPWDFGPDVHGSRLVFLNGSWDYWGWNQIIIWQADIDSLIKINVESFESLVALPPQDHPQTEFDVQPEWALSAVSNELTLLLYLKTSDSMTRLFAMRIDYGSSIQGLRREIDLSYPMAFSPLVPQDDQARSVPFNLMDSGHAIKAYDRIIRIPMGRNSRHSEECLEIDIETYTCSSQVCDEPIHPVTEGDLARTGTYDIVRGHMNCYGAIGVKRSLQDRLERFEMLKYKKLILRGPKIVPATANTIRSEFRKEPWKISQVKCDRIITDKRLIVVKRHYLIHSPYQPPDPRLVPPEYTPADSDELTIAVFDSDLVIRPNYFE